MSLIRSDHWFAGKQPVRCRVVLCNWYGKTLRISSITLLYNRTQLLFVITLLAVYHDCCFLGDMETNTAKRQWRQKKQTETFLTYTNMWPIIFMNEFCYDWMQKISMIFILFWHEKHQAMIIPPPWLLLLDFFQMTKVSVSKIKSDSVLVVSLLNF